jgi:hypothetical protein
MAVKIRTATLQPCQRGHAWRVAEVSMMRFRFVGRVYLLATMVALAALNTLSPRVALAQIPDAPGDFSDPDGGADVGDDGDAPALEAPWRRRHKPKSDQPTPDPALNTIDEFERAKERASGTPEPEPTQRGGFSGKE